MIHNQTFFIVIHLYTQRKKKEKKKTVLFAPYLLERNHDTIKSKLNEKKFRDVALMFLVLMIENIFNNFQNEIHLLQIKI